VRERERERENSARDTEIKWYADTYIAVIYIERARESERE
jgi:hypothetical protein